MADRNDPTYLSLCDAEDIAEARYLEADAAVTEAKAAWLSSRYGVAFAKGNRRLREGEEALAVAFYVAEQRCQQCNDQLTVARHAREDWAGANLV